MTRRPLNSLLPLNGFSFQLPDADLLFAAGLALEAGIGDLVAVDEIAATLDVQAGDRSAEVVVVVDEVADGPQEARSDDLRTRFAAQLDAPLCAVSVTHVELRIGPAVVFRNKGERRFGLMILAPTTPREVLGGDVAGVFPEHGILDVLGGQRAVLVALMLVCLRWGGIVVVLSQRGVGCSCETGCKQAGGEEEGVRGPCGVPCRTPCQVQKLRPLEAKGDSCACCGLLKTSRAPAGASV